MASESPEIPYQQIFENDLSAISVHTVVLDEAGRPVDYRFDAVNRGFETFTGLKAAEVLGKTVRQVLPGTEEVWIQRYGQVALSGEPQTFTSYSQEMGKWYAVSAFRHKPLGFTVSFLDITVIKQAEQAWKESEDRLERVLEGSQLGYWDWEIPTGKVHRNARWAQMLGYTLEEIELNVRQWTDLHHPDDRALAWTSLQNHLEGRTPVHRAEYRMRCRDGQYKWILDQARVVARDSQGRPTRMSGTHTDIDELKRAEDERSRLQAQLNQSQKLENLGSLAGGIAHDMNNVLAAILTLSSAKVMRLSADDPHLHAFETIAKAAERGGKMVKSLLEFARQRPVEEKILDLNHLILEEVRLLERTTFSRISLSMDLAPDLKPVLGDPAALAHALMNLSVNAVDAMPEGGNLSLRTMNSGADGVEVVVEDTGTGMSPDVLERALDPFFTTKPVGKGTGLGLSLAYTTMQAHHGRLTISSVPGQGTRVTLWFPASAPGGVSESVPEISSAAPGATLKVLVIDDDELIRDSLSATLDSWGYSVRTVPSGELALDVLGGGEVPDVVILDMNMPGLGGAGTLAGIRGILPQVPVLLSTGRSDQTALDLTAAYSGVTLLPKPFGMDELSQLLRTITQASPPETPSETWS